MESNLLPVDSRTVVADVAGVIVETTTTEKKAH
jgi:hypothetical protein